MNSDPLDKLLGNYARQPMPPSPDPTTGVWQEIEIRRRHFWLGVFPVIDWRELFREPRVAIPALALALLTGLLPAAAVDRSRSEARVLRDSLQFDVFSADLSPVLLSGVQAARRAP